MKFLQELLQEATEFFTICYYKNEKEIMVFVSPDKTEFTPGKFSGITTPKYCGLSKTKVKELLPEFAKEFNLTKYSDLAKELK